MQYLISTVTNCYELSRLLLADPRFDINISSWLYMALRFDPGLYWYLLHRPGLNVNEIPFDIASTALMQCVIVGRPNCVKLLLKDDIPSLILEFPFWRALVVTCLLCDATFTPRPLPMHIWKFIFSFLRPRTQVNARMVLKCVPEFAIDHHYYNSGATAIWLAAALGRHQCLQELLAYPGIDVEQADDKNRSPLMIAQERGNDLCVRLLLTSPVL